MTNRILFSVKERHFFKFDKIRALKLLEMFQHTILFYVIALYISKFLNENVFTNTKKEIKKMSIFELSISIIMQLFILILCFFFIRKFILIFPSVSTIIDNKFKPHTTLQYSTHIAFIFFFLEIIKNLKFKIKLIHEKMK
tara:strand:- start:4992 stop:5411 length:420 start_codon:yes stop_codon:yes gene_type:complete